jgi:hypothetical protein
MKATVIGLTAYGTSFVNVGLRVDEHPASPAAVPVTFEVGKGLRIGDRLDVDVFVVELAVDGKKGE